MISVVARIDPYYQDRFRPWLAVAPRLRDLGFTVRLTADDPDDIGDVNVVQLEYLLKDPSLVERLIGRNLIVYERTGCAPVTTHTAPRRIANDPRLRGWIKDIRFRDPALYNAPMTNSRLHLNTLPFPDGSLPTPVPPELPLTDEAVARIGSCLPIYMYPRMDPFLAQPVAPISKRRIDVFFAGNMDFPLPQVVRHRWTACEAILRTRRRAAIYTGNLLKPASYATMLTQPKILVSPYGSGGYSWKDFEAMYMGIVLVKPDNEFSLTYGFDVFDGEKHLVKCRPDFSDLDEVIQRILDDQPFFDEMTERNRAAIMAARDDEMIARDLAGLFARAAGG